LLGVFHGDDAVATPADVRASWRARKGAAEGEGERKWTGRGRRRRVGMCRSWRWSSGCGIGGEQQWQEQSKGEAVVPEEDEAGRCQGDLFAIPKNFRDLSVN
jgi:hypothetical protein